MSGKSTIGVGLIGCGTVGSGVVKLLLEQAATYRARLGVDLELKAVLVREKDRHYKTEQVPAGKLIFDVEQFFATPGLDIVVELAGGRGAISQFVRRALQAKKHVVTANKALLAAEGPELFALARQNGVSISFEASCGGGIPCMTATQFGLMANQAQAIYGILNGTCNYILTEMTRGGKTYATALKEAQETGYAEADPTLDVSGRDAAAKIAILASLAFGVQATGEQVWSEGIDTLNLDDVRFGAELGYDVKLLAIAQKSEDGRLSLRVHPSFVHKDALLAQVRGSFNAVSYYGHAVGNVIMYGRGAGMMPTASAVVSDVMNIASGWYPKAFLGMTIWADQQKPVAVLPAEELVSRYYLRMNVKDQAGVMARIATILGDAGISISAVMQHEPAAGETAVPVVITTHEAKQGALQGALKAISALPVVEGPAVCVRIVDLPQG